MYAKEIKTERRIIFVKVIVKKMRLMLFVR